MAKLSYKRLEKHKDVYIEEVIRIPPLNLICIDDTDTKGLLQIGNIYLVDELYYFQSVTLQKDNSNGIRYSLNRFKHFPFTSN